MSDLKKESLEIEPPKPKKLKTVKQKAKQSVKGILERSRQKVATAEQALRSAKRHAENVKSKFKSSPFRNVVLCRVFKSVPFKSGVLRRVFACF